MPLKITYPQYRKYPNEKSFFKIISPTQFEEIQILGNKTTLHYFDAKILPDKNFVYDLTFNFSDHWIECDAQEYELLRERGSDCF